MHLVLSFLSGVHEPLGPCFGSTFGAHRVSQMQQRHARSETCSMRHTLRIIGLHIFGQTAYWGVCAVGQTAIHSRITGTKQAERRRRKILSK